MEVILDQQNLSSLDFVSSPSQTGQRASEGDCSLHRLSLQLSLYLLPTWDRLSSNSTSTVAKSTDANSRSAARQRGRVNASLLFTSVATILPRLGRSEFSAHQMQLCLRNYEWEEKLV